MRGQSWTSDRRRVFERRLKSLHLYDALIAPSEEWAVYLIGDMWMKPLYAIYRLGIEVAKRRRLESTLDYLMDNNAPIELEFVPDGGLHFLEDDIAVVVQTPKLHLLPVPNVPLPVLGTRGVIRPLVSAFFAKTDNWLWVDRLLA